MGSFYNIYSINIGKTTYIPKIVAIQNADIVGVTDIQVNKREMETVKKDSYS